MCDHVPQYRLVNSMEVSCSCGLVRVAERDLEQFTTRRAMNNFLEKTITDAVVKENPFDGLLKKPTKLAAVEESVEVSTPRKRLCPQCGLPSCPWSEGYEHETRINS